MLPYFFTFAGNLNLFVPMINRFITTLLLLVILIPCKEFYILRLCVILGVINKIIEPPLHLFIWALTSFWTLCRSCHDRQYYGQSKPVRTVGQGSVL